jgi:hypothetical protein
MRQRHFAPIRHVPLGSVAYLDGWHRTASIDRFKTGNPLSGGGLLSTIKLRSASRTLLEVEDPAKSLTEEDAAAIVRIPLIQEEASGTNRSTVAFTRLTSLVGTAISGATPGALQVTSMRVTSDDPVEPFIVTAQVSTAPVTL